VKRARPSHIAGVARERETKPFPFTMSVHLHPRKGQWESMRMARLVQCRHATDFCALTQSSAARHKD